jgi:metal-responsive CopG/Arc/MetJ family transcriptional regulator
MGRGDYMAVDKKKNTQVLVTLPSEMLEKIDQYWHDKKLMNRNETIRQLITKGLESEKAQG